MKLTYSFLLLLGCSQFFFVDAMHAGQRDIIENVPYTAQLYLKFKGGFVSFCGAAILSENWIITAAHCVWKPNLTEIQVRVGSNYTMNGGTIFNSSKVIVHEDYRPSTRWNNDICLIKVDEPIAFNGSVRPIPISHVTPKPGDIVTASGYGYNYGSYEEDLQVGEQAVVSRKYCRKKYSKEKTSSIAITENSFCTDSSTVDLCGGDSGDPVVFNGYLVGIAVEACESPIPNIITNVPHYYNWIVMHTKINFNIEPAVQILLK